MHKEPIQIEQLMLMVSISGEHDDYITCLRSLTNIHNRKKIAFIAVN